MGTSTEIAPLQWKEAHFKIRQAIVGATPEHGHQVDLVLVPFNWLVFCYTDFDYCWCFLSVILSFFIAISSSAHGD